MLAAVFGILSAMLMFAFLSNKGGGDDAAVNDALTGGAGAKSVVVVGERPINVGDRITDDMITVKTLPLSALNVEGYFDADNRSQLVGKVATAPLLPNEPVVAARVTTFEGQNTIAWKVPDGMRGLSLQVPHEAWIASGLPQPGDRVDVIGITTLTKIDPLTGEERPDVIAGFVAQDVEILAVSQKLVKSVPNLDAKATGGSSATGAGGATAPTTASAKPLEDGETYQESLSITLALPPDLSAKVALLDAMDDKIGQYRILPRQKGDSAPVSGKNSWSYEDIFPQTR